MKLLGRILRRKFDADARAVIQIKLLDECLRGMFEADARVCLVALQKKFNFVIEIPHCLTDHASLFNINR